MSALQASCKCLTLVVHHARHSRRFGTAMQQPSKERHAHKYKYKAKEKEKEKKKEKEDLFYMSGYQALQKKFSKSKLGNVQWNPEHLNVDENKSILAATKPHEVVNIVREALHSSSSTVATSAMRDKTIMNSIFTSGIRKCVEFHAYPQCWHLFALAKDTNHVSTQLYTTMIWMMLNSSRRTHFHKALQLYTEMKENNIALTSNTYTALINGCAKKLCHEQGLQIWRDLQQDENVIVDEHCWNAMIQFHCFNKEMQRAQQCYHDMQHTAMITPTNYTYSSLLNGYAAVIGNARKHDAEKQEMEQLVTRADNVMFDAVSAWQANCCNENEKELHDQMFVFQAWMNVYASAGDVFAVLTIFQWLLKTNGVAFDYKSVIGKTKKHKTQQLEQWLNEEDDDQDENDDTVWKKSKVRYPLKVQIFGIVLKACLNQTKLKEAKLHGLVELIMQILLNKATLNLTPSTDIYGILFQLYARMLETVNVDEVEKLYQDMLSKCGQNAKPSERELNEYGRTYLLFMDHHGASNAQKQDFLFLFKKQFQTLEVTPSIYTKQLIEQYSV